MKFIELQYNDIERNVMPNKDRYHDVVIHALQKSGWTIVAEQIYISVGETAETVRRLYIDIQVQRDDTVLALIEVKALDVSPVHELMELLGQYLVYREGLDYVGDTTPLYVAVTDKGHEMIIQHPLGQRTLAKNPVPLIIYNVEREEITQWIPPL